ncbi:hypothetical protein ACN9MH_26315 [Paenibacillus silvae]|uniref:hypothetical protein n=1 Tax=Paenibacillus silvae TaxID=1325358 RepID=UPI003CF8FFDF
MENKAQIDQLLDELTILTETFTVDIDEKLSDQVEAFVNERQLIVEKLIGLGDTYKTSQQQQAKLNHILTYDALIQSRILALKDEANKWLVQRNAARNQRNVYEAKYAADSYLMDKRK